MHKGAESSSTQRTTVREELALSNWYICCRTAFEAVACFLFSYLCEAAYAMTVSYTLLGFCVGGAVAAAYAVTPRFTWWPTLSIEGELTAAAVRALEVPGARFFSARSFVSTAAPACSQLLFHWLGIVAARAMSRDIADVRMSAVAQENGGGVLAASTPIDAMHAIVRDVSASAAGFIIVVTAIEVIVHANQHRAAIRKELLGERGGGSSSRPIFYAAGRVVVFTLASWLIMPMVRYGHLTREVILFAYGSEDAASFGGGGGVSVYEMTRAAFFFNVFLAKLGGLFMGAALYGLAHLFFRRDAPTATKKQKDVLSSTSSQTRDAGVASAAFSYLFGTHGDGDVSGAAVRRRSHANV